MCDFVTGRESKNSLNSFPEYCEMCKRLLSEGSPHIYVKGGQRFHLHTKEALKVKEQYNLDLSRLVHKDKAYILDVYAEEFKERVDGTEDRNPRYKFLEDFCNENGIDILNPANLPSVRPYKTRERVVLYEIVKEEDSIPRQDSVDQEFTPFSNGISH